ncbi:alpha-1,6-mannosyl-glycoprotein 4-beta-N-acetylglucosaminyltransferase-like [Xenia sp. Carnegie-2017]|uniref:alpha-1,6-mannosyl-glycoprotein 4-beta-N-acetylglucosaminyltransferase-like n=1 Tax=Xenia sp. Carnegie-2017 TaxID=2897299 RepID=UPI001F049291|nr:alpha-1,6-mannosyl-glycoprotein 4-beta-N-acetylglucosaminyltransferase-like [Xenia sp. Carnegie-2017]
MLLSRSCKIGPSVTVAILFSLFNTLIIIVYLGPLHNKDGSLNPGTLPCPSSNLMSHGEGEQQVLVVNHNELDSFENEFKENNFNNNRTEKTLFKLSDKANSLKRRNNLQHAKDKLKFNANLMKMIGHSPAEPVDIVIGIPTVKRQSEEYLTSTLRQLVNFLNTDERKRCHIVVFTANFDGDGNERTAEFINQQFANEVELGLIQVIKPDKSFYPTLKDLPLLWKDKPDRVFWRSKQCIDYALLFLYCRNLGKYYLQLEDDVSISPSYFREMKNFIVARGSTRWSTLQFGPGGFIGMLFRTVDLDRLALFVKMYYWVFPVDLLFRHFNDIHLFGNSPRDVYSPPCFIHLGKQSSLKGQTRKVDDDIRKMMKSRPIIRRYTNAENPSAFLSTSIRTVEQNTIDRPYRKLNVGYFWGSNVNLNDFILLDFVKKVRLARVIFDSGASFAPIDILADAKLETAHSAVTDGCLAEESILLPRSIANGIVDSGWLKNVEYSVKCIKMTITKLNLDERGKPTWLLIKEIAVWTK